MTATDTALRDHAPGHQRPGGISSSLLGMVLFIASEVMFFGGLFGAYFTIRAAATTWPPQQAPKLNTGYAAALTAVLVTSSVFMQLAVYAIRRGDQRWLVRWLTVTLAFGVAFLGMQGYDYYNLGVHEGFRLSSGVFGSLFYTMTGFHGAHVFGGAAFISIVLLRARSGQFTARYHDTVEMASYYWHFVDVVWLGLFSTLYLLKWPPKELRSDRRGPTVLSHGGLRPCRRGNLSRVELGSPGDGRRRPAAGVLHRVPVHRGGPVVGERVQQAAQRGSRHGPAGLRPPHQGTARRARQRARHPAEHRPGDLLARGRDAARRGRLPAPDQGRRSRRHRARRGAVRDRHRGVVPGHVGRHARQDLRSRPCRGARGGRGGGRGGAGGASRASQLLRAAPRGHRDRRRGLGGRGLRAGRGLLRARQPAARGARGHPRLSERPAQGPPEPSGDGGAHGRRRRQRDRRVDVVVPHQRQPPRHRPGRRHRHPGRPRRH